VAEQLLGEEDASFANSWFAKFWNDLLECIAARSGGHGSLNGVDLHLRGTYGKTTIYVS
jgi:hypothetical protein